MLCLLFSVICLLTSVICLLTTKGSAIMDIKKMMHAVKHNLDFDKAGMVLCHKQSTFRNLFNIQTIGMVGA